MASGVESPLNAVMQVYEDWVKALDACSDLADGVRQCRALLPAGYDPDMGLVLLHPQYRDILAQQEHFPEVERRLLGLPEAAAGLAELRRRVREAHSTGAAWLAKRFPAVWAGVPGMASPLPRWLLNRVIEGAITCGAWSSPFILQDIALSISLASMAKVKKVGIEVYDWAGPSSEARALLWSNMAPVRNEHTMTILRATGGGPRPGGLRIVLSLPYGIEGERIAAALVQAWPKIRPYIGPPGRRRQGTAPDYGRTVKLYELWRANPTNTPERPDLWDGRKTITWAEFAERARESRQISGWDEDTSDRTIEKSTKVAIAYFAPDPAVPATLEAYRAARTR